MSQGATGGPAQSKSHRSARRRHLRAALGLATAPPWMRAPFLLVRYPGLLLAIATAAGILALAGASSPLFLSSSGNALLQENIRATCPWVAGVQIVTPGPILGQTYTGQPAPEVFRETSDFIDKKARQIPHSAPVELQIVGTTVQASGPGGTNAYPGVRLYTRDGAFDHIQKLQGAGGQGVWLPDTTASSLDLRAGDNLRLASADGVVDVRVAGLYRDLATLPRSQFWCAQDHLIYPLSGFAYYNPPPFVIADRSTFIEVSKKLHDRGTVITWEIPIDSRGLTVPDARRVSDAIQRHTPSFQKLLYQFGSTVRVDSSFGFILEKAEATTDSLRSPVWTISVAGRLVVLLVIAGSGVYWVHRRRTEAALLSARGTGPLAIAAKALLEALPVAAAASVLGWLAGIWLIKSLGPSDLLDKGSQAAALGQVAWTAVIGLLLLAVVAAVATRRDTEPSEARGRRSLAGTPWEVAVLALAGAALYEFLTRAPRSTGDVSNPPKVDALVLLFPILFVAGAAGLVARGLRVVLPRLRSTGRAWPPSAYLATRRLAVAPRIVLALLTASALSIGILAYAGALSSSIDATSNAKARVFTGSDLDVALGEDIPVPPSIAPRSTKVTEIDRASFLSDQLPVEVLGVDPSTFARAAFWDPSFADRPLGQLLDAIAPSPSPSAPVPVIAAGRPVGRSQGTLSFRYGETKLPVRIVAQIRAFPSMSPSDPLLVADAKTLADRGVNGTVNLWVKGQPQPALNALAGSHALIVSSVTADEIKGQQSFESLAWTFGFLQALGIMSGLIVLGGILLYLEARQRSRAISYALASRMGLSRRSNRSSVALELGALLAIGCVVGIALAWIAARIVYRKLDPLPQLPPAPLFRLPLAVFGLTALAVLAAAWLGAWRVQRQAERVSVGEVMRVAG